MVLVLAHGMLVVLERQTQAVAVVVGQTIAALLTQAVLVAQA